jgi:hypothetical protein
VTDTSPITDTAPVTSEVPLTPTAVPTLTYVENARIGILPTPSSIITGTTLSATPVPTTTVARGHGVPGQTWQTLSPGYKERSILPVRGFTTYYNPGVMEEVLTYRLTVGDVQPCPECIGHVALIREGDIGRKVWLQLDATTYEGPFLVIDCAHTWDVASLVRQGWGIDLDYQTAERWGFKVRHVNILDAPPPGWMPTPTPLPPEAATPAPTSLPVVEGEAAPGSAGPVPAETPTPHPPA